MQLIDRYLLRQFLQNLLIFFCSLTGLYVIIDAFNNLEEFITFTEQNKTLATASAPFDPASRRWGHSGRRRTPRRIVPRDGGLLCAAGHFVL